MNRRRVTASTNAETLVNDPSSLMDVIRHLEGNYERAQEWIHLATDILGEGHSMLRSWTQSDELLGNPPQLSGESAKPTVRPAATVAPALRQAAESSAPSTVTPSNGAPRDPPLLRIHCLGKFRVYRGDQETESWSSNRAKGILKLLVLHLGKPLPKEVFLEAFWRDQPAQSANSSFRVAIHKLRAALGSNEADGQAPKYILSHGSNYSIDIQAPLWVDVEEFEANWRAGRALERSGQYGEAIARYMAAESVYEGDLLEEDIYEEWTLIKREALVDIYLSILGKISDYHFQAGDYESCIECCQNILAKDHCREDAYQQLIRCYTKLGQRSRALRWYRLCGETLLRELDCPVSAETEELYNILTASDQ